jgi:IS5 family transposase
VPRASHATLVGGRPAVPDETTVCKFRHLLEEHNLGEEILGTAFAG